MQGRRMSCRTAAHPRAGGENVPSRAVGGPLGGSSPRGRGKPGSSERWLFGLGLIPARAGKTRIVCHVFSTPEAHPRAGGENWTGTWDGVSGFGSSPRGRGKHALSGGTRATERLIPARAGKTSPRSSRAWSISAHPRAGGENLEDTHVGHVDAGSSPRGRGKHGPGEYPSPNDGLIPARAGKTRVDTLTDGG